MSNALKTLTAVLLVGTIAILACQKSPDFDALHQEIRALHQKDIEAHLAKDAAYLAKPTAPGYLSIAGGQVDTLDAAQVEQILKPYLNSTTFTTYGDVAEPIIGFSDDASLAWAIVQVRIAGTRHRSDGPSNSYDTLWAWFTLYRRSGKGWLRLMDVSTNRPYLAENP